MSSEVRGSATTRREFWNARLVGGHYTKIGSDEFKELSWRFLAFLMQKHPSLTTDHAVSQWERSKRPRGGGPFHKTLFLGSLYATGEVFGPDALVEEHIRDLDCAPARKANLFYGMAVEAWHHLYSPTPPPLADSEQMQTLLHKFLKAFEVVLNPNRRKTRVVLSGDIALHPAQVSPSETSPLVLPWKDEDARALDPLVSEAETAFQRGEDHNNRRAIERLESIGTRLGNTFPKATFQHLAADDGLEIIIDAASAPPIEITRLGGRYLATRHLMARCVDFDVKASETGPWPRDRIVYVGDPSRTLRFELVERAFFQDTLPEFTPDELSIEIYDSLDKGEFLSVLAAGDCSLLHFSGHGGIDHDGVPYLLLARNQRLRADEIPSQPAAGAKPQLVVLNACLTAVSDLPQSVSASKTRLYERFRTGFANSFIRSGARLFIGTLWPVGDSAAARFATELYRFMFAVEMDVDESLWRVKRCLVERPGLVDALAYVLFKRSPDDQLHHLTKPWKVDDPMLW